MSDKENIDLQDVIEVKSPRSSRTHSSASNISGVARSLVGHAMEDAVTRYNAEVPERENLSSLSGSIIGNVVENGVTLHKEVSESESTTSIARSMVAHALEDAYNSLNKGLMEREGTDIFSLNEIQTEDYYMTQDEFESSEKEAFTLVDRAINSAIRRLEDDVEKNRQPVSNIVQKELLEDQFRRINLLENEICVANIEWPKIIKFNEELGEKKIDEFIMTWRLGDEWLHCIDYLGCQDSRYDKRHKYRVRFSIPTNRTPIPKASASIYFTIVVSKIKPSDFTVDVFYVVESTQLVHKPGEYIFCELWLRRILDQKNSLMRFINF